jgi:amino acid adenylation domain-containing protein/thioester reductase-like protein
MTENEGLSAKLWLEDREHATESRGATCLPHTHTFSLNKSDIKLFHHFLKFSKRNESELTHAAWGLLLNRLCTSDSIIYGVANAHIKTKNIMLHGSTKPLTSIINETLTVNDYLNAIKSQMNAKGEKDISEVRYLFLKNDPTSTRKKSKLELHKFRLSLSHNDHIDEKFTLIYHPDFFQKEVIHQIADYYTTILMGLCDSAKERVIDIELTIDDQKDIILNKWSRPHYSFKTVHLSQAIHELIAIEANAHPTKLAITHLNDTVTFAEMETSATSLAHFLFEAGIRRGDNIAVMMERTPSLIITMLAIFKAGAVFVPINPKYPNERTEFVIENSHAKIVLTNDIHKLPEKFTDKGILLSHDWRHLPTTVNSRDLPIVQPEDMAYIIYTSGTTGKPKGVTIPHRGLSNLTAWYRSCYQITHEDRASQMASQGFDTYICETMPILGCGASVHIVDDNIKLTPSLFFDWIKSEKITIGDLPTAYAQMLFTMRWPDNLSLRMLKIGGESCTRYPDKKYTFDIWNVYGPTETTIEATYYKMYEANQEPNLHRKSRTPSIGKIIANCEAYIVDKYMQLVPPGVAGELLIGGPCVSKGYYQRDELTTAKFIKNIFNKKSEYLIYRTGDLALWRPDGNLEFVGRIDNQVKIRGYRIELGDIENVISKYPDVREVAVIAKESPNGEKSIIAYIVPNLDKVRYHFQERCLISMANSRVLEAITDDISKHGIGLSGITETIPVGEKVKLHVKLPGFHTGKDISARLIWQIEHRAGFAFDLNSEEQAIISKCIEYLLASHNIMDLVLSASTKRNLRRALTKKLPEYMVPASFVSLIEFPLTFSGKVDLKALPPPDDFEKNLRKQFIPASTATEKRVAEIWKQILNRDTIGMEDNFFDLGGNSLRAAELSVRIMDTFNISIPAQILFDLSYVPILAQYIDTRGTKYNTQSFIQDEIERDIILHENIMPTGQLSKKVYQPENILLTGAGGFLGVYMLNELLKSTNAKIHCLVRKSEFESAASRLMTTIKNFGLENDVSLSNRRIIAVPSELSYDEFGIPHDQYEEMASKIDTIYHCGAQVNIMASYNKLRGSNVQGTSEIIKFATHRMDKPINYVSTLSAAYLKDENGALTEEFPSKSYEDLFGGYAISKWVSERLLTELKDRGTPTAIYRSGYISGDSTSGVTNINDSLLLLIKGCIELGFAPDMQEQVTILPVDFVSKAIIKISLFTPEESNTYHIDHPTGIMWVDLVSWLNDYGYKIKVISMNEWKKKLRTITQDNALYPFLPYYLSLPDDYYSPRVRTNKATAALKLAGLDYPVIDDRLLNLYFDFLCNAGFYHRPEEVKRGQTT